jgi:predicted flap endonuclease-1-like 5' DNA nuclease
MSDKIKKNITETIEEVKGKIDAYTDGVVEEKKTKKTKTTKTKKTAKKAAAPKATKEEAKVVIEKTDVQDDLKVIKGIGPVLEKSLNELNITSYAQIAKITIKDLTKVLNDAGINAKIYDLSGWKAQAKLALKGDMEAVKNWTKK